MQEEGSDGGGAYPPLDSLSPDTFPDTPIEWVIVIVGTIALVWIGLKLRDLAFGKNSMRYRK